MKTTLSPDNPFGLDSKGHFWEILKNVGVSDRHLDFGAHDGQMLRRLVESGAIINGVGVDANSKVVAKSQVSLPSNIRLEVIKKGSALPFPDASFTSSSIVGVLEHIHDQDRKSTRLNSSHVEISYAVFCLKKKTK